MCESQKIVEQVANLVTQFPNDMMLGEAIRKLFTIELKYTEHETTKGKCNCVCGKKQTK